VPTEIEIRRGVEADHPLVYKATARMLRQSEYYADLPQAEYTAMINAIIGRLLKTWVLYIAAFRAVPDETAGFLLCVPGVAAASLFVKPDYQRKGVARMLMQHAGLTNFIAVLGSPKAFRLAHGKGLLVRHSPYFGGILADI
jgi:GNAT superfamily N-acetyltransferase